MNPDKARAAQEILRHLESGGTVFEDFTFRGCSNNVIRFHDEFADDYHSGDYSDPKVYLRAVIRANSKTATPVRGKAEAAQHILDHINGGGDVYEDLSYAGSPDIVGEWCDELADEYYNGWRPRIKDYLRHAIEVNKNAPPEAPSDLTPVIIPDPFKDFNTAGKSQQPDLTWSPVAPNTPIEVQVRAVDRDGNASEWSESVFHLTERDDVPPPTPTPFVVTSYLGQLRMEWDGKGV